MIKPWFLENILQTPGILSALISQVKKQQQFINKNLDAALTQARNEQDGSLDEKDFKKITHYYGLAVPAILGEQICALRGTKMTLQERKALTFQGAMTGLGDDFFDKQGTAAETVKAFIEHPEKFSGQTSSERLFLSFYKKSLDYAHDPELVKTYLRKVFAAQVESKKQAKPGLSQEEILNITLNKGGVSVLFYRAAMSHPFRNGEEEALYKIGGLMQFGNDVFDMYNDRNENIHTLLTTTKQIDETRNMFLSVMHKAFDSAYLADFPRKNVKKFLRLISMSLCSRCFVCFDQLEKKEAATDNIFFPALYSRNDLVCDLDKTSNKWKSVKYFIRQKISP